MNKRKNILWLASWYPNNNDAFDGDFIQRQARAASLYNDIHVIYVTDTEIKTSREEIINSSTGLTEQIIYFKKKTGLLSRLQKQLRWRQLFYTATEDYITKYGKPDVVHVHIPWKTGLIALRLKNKYGLDFIVSEHWGIYNNSIKDNFASKPAVIKGIIKKVFSEAKHFISVSKYLAEGIRKEVTEKEYTVIENVVDTSLFYYKEQKYSRFSFIHVSNMAPLKNISKILKAFSHLITSGADDVQLVLVGNRNHQYKQEAEELGLLNKSVFFRGEISYVDVAKEMQLSHAMILFSETETFSCVTAEALCCGLPVVARKTGALPELINETNGILVDSANENDLVAALLQMKNNYQLFDQKMISEKARKEFDYATIGQKLQALYSNPVFHS